ncbi:MAG: hypothetical protein E7063_02050 [Spirochaetaceae bacterium]|nr:hypothetical protein [Spirochaetaceae bacterium]
MKEITKKIAYILQYIFGWGIFIALFVGGISFLGYLVALFIGGEIAQNICHFIYKILYPILVYISSVSVIIGLIKMYLCGETALSTKK